MQFAFQLDGGSALFDELNSTSDSKRVQEIYNQILGTIADKASGSRVLCP
jgi:hypothetical protein